MGLVFLFIGLSIVLCADFEVSLGMSAYGANIGSLYAQYHVAAVTAFPKGYAALLENFLGFNIVEKLAIALLVGLLNSCNAAELSCQLQEAFLFGIGCHAVIHVGPLIVFALGCVEEVLCGVAQLTQSLEPKLCVLFLVFSGLQEDLCDLLEAGLLCDGCEIGIFIAGHGFACECFPKILLGLAACEGSLNGSDHLKKLCALLASGAGEIGGHGTLVNVTTNFAFPLFHYIYLRSVFIFLYGLIIHGIDKNFRDFVT